MGLHTLIYLALIRFMFTTLTYTLHLLQLKLSEKKSPDGTAEQKYQKQILKQ